jgi:hypothetical protein
MRVVRIAKLEEKTLGTETAALADGNRGIAAVDFQTADDTSTQELDARQPFLLFQVVQQVVQVGIGQDLISFKDGI